MTRERILWRVANRVPLRWRVWDGAWVVFHPESGDTHLLDPLAVEVLRALEAAPAGADELAGTFADRGAVERLLAVLDEAGLIEPFDDPL